MTANRLPGGHEAHPACSAFPLLGEAELAALAEDIKRYGLRRPIVTHEKKILIALFPASVLSRKWSLGDIGIHEPQLELV